jgi:hypothetical protein
MYISQSFCDYVLKNDIVWQMNYPLVVCIAVAVSKIVGYTKIRFKIKISWKQNLDQSNFSRYFFYKKQKVKTLIWFLCFPNIIFKNIVTETLANIHSFSIEKKTKDKDLLTQ